MAVLRFQAREYIELTGRASAATGCRLVRDARIACNRRGCNLSRRQPDGRWYVTTNTVGAGGLAYLYRAATPAQAASASALMAGRIQHQLRQAAKLAAMHLEGNK